MQTGMTTKEFSEMTTKEFYRRRAKVNALRPALVADLDAFQAPAVAATAFVPLIKRARSSFLQRTVSLLSIRMARSGLSIP